MENKIIKQISVFAENRPGRLEKITHILTSAQINIRAFTIAEAGDFGVVRMVVDRPDTAHGALHDAGFTVSETDVIGIEMSDSPGGLHEIATIFGRNSINVDYAYAYATADRAILLVRVDNTRHAIDVLSGAGVKLIGLEDVK